MIQLYFIQTHVSAAVWRNVSHKVSIAYKAFKALNTSSYIKIMEGKDERCDSQTYLFPDIALTCVSENI